MQVKRLWNRVPVPAKLKLAWNRFTLSRLTTAYFIFSIVHFIIQLSFQIRAFTINADAAQFLNNIVVQGKAFNNSLPVLSGDALYMCSWLPSNLDPTGDNCPVIWNGTKGNNAVGTQSDNQRSTLNNPAVPDPSVTVITSVSVVISTSSAVPTVTNTVIVPDPASSTPTVQTASTPSRRPQTTTVFVTTTRPTNGVVVSNKSSDEDDDDDDDKLSKRSVPRVLAFEESGQIKVNISGMGFQDTPATLDTSCLWALNWPVSVLDNTKREDLVFIAFQFWVLGMSIVALLNESIPHILASLLTHVMATTWAADQIKATANFRSNFNRVVTNGACDGISLLPNYWRDRGIAELLGLAFNALAMLISLFLTWKLFKLFGWQTFKRVGASRSINRIYKLVLVLSITIQLCLYFMLVTVSLWLDQLFNSPIGDLASFRTLYKVSSFVTLVLLIPWLATGWFAVRRELRVPMAIFLALSVLYLGGWGVMFFSTTFRWTFISWRFFSIMSSASVLLTVISLVLGIFCRLNFGKGLLRYLNAHQSLPGDDFSYRRDSDIEKVHFPSNEKPVPTWSATFGSGADVPPPGQMFTAQGPRFFNGSTQPFDKPTSYPVAPPPNAYTNTITRKVSDGSSYSGGTVVRSDTRLSDKSIGSLASYYSYGDRSHARTDSQPKRWIIE